MPTDTSIVEWPSVRDVGRELDITAVYIHRMIRTGRLRAVKTSLGYLVDPASVREFVTMRARSPRARRRAS